MNKRVRIRKVFDVFIPYSLLWDRIFEFSYIVKMKYYFDAKDIVEYWKRNPNKPWLGTKFQWNCRIKNRLVYGRVIYKNYQLIIEVNLPDDLDLKAQFEAEIDHIVNFILGKAPY